MTRTGSESHIDGSRQERTEGVNDLGKAYRFGRLSLPLVLEDLCFNKAGDPRCDRFL